MQLPRRIGPDLEAHLRAFHKVWPEEDAPDEPPQPDLDRAGAADESQVWGNQGHVWVCTTCAWQTAGPLKPPQCANCAGSDVFVEQEM